MAENVWERIDRELQRRSKKNLAPTSWAALAALIDESKQTAHNWKSRGVPPKQYQPLADALGWSMDELLGKTEVRNADEGLPEDHRRLFGSMTEEEQQRVHAYAIRLVARKHRGVLKHLSAPAAPAQSSGGHMGGLVNSNFGDLDDEEAAGGSR